MTKNIISLLFVLISFVGFAQKPLSDFSIEELKQEKVKAVEAEDYEKAAIYKSAIELKQQIDSTYTSEEITAINIQLDNLLTKKEVEVVIEPKKKVATTNYVKNDLYGEVKVCWLGADFSLFKLTDPKLIGRDEELYKYIAAWQKIYNEEVPVGYLQRWFLKRNIKDYRHAGQGLYQQYLTPVWITETENKLDSTTIQNHVFKYQVSEEAVGLVFIVENMDKSIKKMRGYFVWFDMETKKIIVSARVEGKPSPGGLSTYWGRSLVPATRFYVDKIYKKERKVYLEAQKAKEAVNQE